MKPNFCIMSDIANKFREAIKQFNIANKSADVKTKTAAQTSLLSTVNADGYVTACDTLDLLQTDGCITLGNAYPSQYVKNATALCNKDMSHPACICFSPSSKNFNPLMDSSQCRNSPNYPAFSITQPIIDAYNNSRPPRSAQAVNELISIGIEPTAALVDAKLASYINTSAPIITAASNTPNLNSAVINLPSTPATKASSIGYMTETEQKVMIFILIIVILISFAVIGNYAKQAINTGNWDKEF